jgi:hypothetical protein
MSRSSVLSPERFAPFAELPARLRRFFDPRALLAVGVAFIATRLVILAVVFASSATLPVLPGGTDFAFPDNIMWDGLVRFDSWWYLDIVQNGYTNDTAGSQSTTAFFPGYPLSIRLVKHLTGGNVFAAGLVVSNIGFLIALFFLYRWSEREYGNAVAGRFVFYLAAAPTAVFFSAMYTEGLYIALMAAAFYFAGGRQWIPAAIAGAAASATRNTGILMAAVIALEGLHAAGVRFRPPSGVALSGHLKAQLSLVPKAWQALVAAAAACAGLIVYMIYLWREFDDPLAFVNAQAQWGRSTSGNGVFQIVSNTREQLYHGQHFWLGQISIERLGNLAATLAFLPIVAIVAWRFRPALAVFTVAAFVIPLSSGSVGSMSRYMLALVPCYLLLAIWGDRPWVDKIVTATFLPLLALNAVLFSHWYFIG